MVVEAERKICYPPARPEPGQSQANLLPSTPSWPNQLAMFAFSQLRVQTFFFAGIAALDLAGFNPTSPDEPNYLSTFLPLLIIFLGQAVIAFLWLFKEKQSSRDIHERADDFQVGQIPRAGAPPEFRNSKDLSELQPGDLLSLATQGGKKVYVPADMVLLAVACDCHKHLRSKAATTCGRCSISLSNLTGEQRTCERQAPELTAFWHTPGQLCSSASLLVPPPSQGLEEFSGSLAIPGQDDIPLSGINFVPRGSLVFGAETVYGLVVYTGRDTKMAHHVKTTAWSDGRVTLLDSLLDKTFLTLIYLIIAGCLAKAVFDFEQNGFKNVVKDWLMVLQKCIPISLMLGVEIINYFVAWRIGRKTGSAFNYKMTTELGHVSHMVLDCNTISGSQVEVDLLGFQGGYMSLAQSSRTASVSRPTSSQTDPADRDLASLALAVCHKNTGGGGRSPSIGVEGEAGAACSRSQEEAMQDAAIRLGYTVEERKGNKIKLRREHDSGPLLGQTTSSQIEILETIPFSPEGAMTGMFVSEQLADSSPPARRLLLQGPPASVKQLVQAETSMHDFTPGGHRTVWFAEARLSEKEWSELEHFVADKAYKRLQNSTKVEKLTEEFFPATLRVIGSVGIKTKLGEEVKAAMESFKEAGIRVSLTMEAPHAETKLILGDLPWSKAGNRVQQIEEPTTAVTELKKIDSLMKAKHEHTEELCLAISGAACQAIRESGNPEDEVMLKNVLRKLGFVVFSQMTSQLKSEIVRLMSQKPTHKSWARRFLNFWLLSMPRTGAILVVGDSSDDIAMMVEGDISTYIDNTNSGQEVCPSEAKHVADFVSKDMKDLRDLVLVHGTWNKRALSEFVFFSIYKNICFVFVQVIFSLILNQHVSESLVYSSQNNKMFNVLYTSLPSMAIGFFYVFYSAEDIIRSPSIYQEPKQRLSNRHWTLAKWAASAILHAAVVSGIIMAFKTSETFKTLKPDEMDLYDYIRPLIITSVVFTVCLKIVISEALVIPPWGSGVRPSFFLSKWMVAASSASCVAILAIHVIPELAELVGEKSDCDFVHTPWFWLVLLACVVACLLTDMAYWLYSYILWTKGKQSSRQEESSIRKRQGIKTSTRTARLPMVSVRVPSEDGHV